MTIEANSDSAAAVIARAAHLACRPTATDDDKREAVRIAYEIGLSEGKVIGGVEMRDCILASLNGAT